MVKYSSAQFFADDYARTLFPLRVNGILAKTGIQKISEYLDKCTNPKETAHSFLPQQRVYASKQNWHLRRTVKLDIVAEYYVYGLIYRNRNVFRRAHSESRSHFGYRFAGGVPISPSESYKAFKEAISKYTKSFKYFLSLDIATYFNSIYHHDLVGWLDNLGGNQNDVESFGQFLREINAGRSVDCLPHGLYPTKMIGNDFLRFVDQSHQLACSQLIRFMDDFYLFDDDPAVLQADFLRIQALIGGKGLSVNPKKTNRLKATHIDLASGIDDIKKKLLDRRRVVVAFDYDDDSPKSS